MKNSFTHCSKSRTDNRSDFPPGTMYFRELALTLQPCNLMKDKLCSEVNASFRQIMIDEQRVEEEVK